MMDLTQGHRWLGTVLLLVLHTLSTCAQLTQPKSGCSFLDDRNIFNIEILKGNHDAACPTSEDIYDQVKMTENKLSETTTDVMQLQTKVLKLMDTNVNLTLEIQKLHDELRAMQYALKPSTSVNVDCPAGYDVKSEELRSCYMFVKRLFDWYSSETFCMSTRGHLVAIQSQEEENFLVNHITASRDLPGYHLWIGANDIAKEGQWLWTGQNQYLTYTQWTKAPVAGKGNVQQPDNGDGNENCVHLHHLLNYGWNDAACNNFFYFICEYKLW